jgi:ABC-2 type transport system permease protein
MSKIGLIIQREYTTRVRKKSFLIMTVLGPLLFAGVIFAPMIIANSVSKARRVVVVDETKSFSGIIPQTESTVYDYSYSPYSLSEVRKLFADSTGVSVLYIPSNVVEANKAILYSKTDPDVTVVSDIEYSLDNIIERSKMKANKLDSNLIDLVKTNIDVVNNVNNKVTSSVYNLVLGYASSFLIYMFIFMYSVQVMRGVMEEKINRIVEIIISSVKPFQLMMGKVIGVCLVGLTQFMIWVVMSGILISVGTGLIEQQQIKPGNARTGQIIRQGTDAQAKTDFAGMKVSKKEAISKGASIIENLENTNWLLVIGCFIFYFLGGYLLYSSLFAAIGSAVDQETETQQFMLPVTAPLILSIIIMQNIIRDPQSTLAVWFSIIPLTSPIAMMARIPFGVSVWQLLLSMLLLISAILGAVWLAGRIYRVGLLMYGKKVSYKELGKWLFYK